MISVARALQCSIKAESCIGTKRFPLPVQNYAVFPTPSKNIPIKNAVNDAMNKWFSLYKPSDVLRWKKPFPRSFENMIWAEASAVGCAVVQFQTNKLYNLVICTYDRGLEKNKSVYEVGRMGSKCQRQMNLGYRGLCNINEFQTKSAEPVFVKRWIQSGKMW